MKNDKLITLIKSLENTNSAQQKLALLKDFLSKFETEIRNDIGKETNKMLDLLQLSI